MICLAPDQQLSSPSSQVSFLGKERYEGETLLLIDIESWFYNFYSFFELIHSINIFTIYLFSRTMLFRKWMILQIAKKAYESVLMIHCRTPNNSHFQDFEREIKFRSERDYNYTWGDVPVTNLSVQKFSSNNIIISRREIKPLP